MLMNHRVSGGTFTVSRWFSLRDVNFRSSSHQHTSGNPAFFAASSRRHMFHDAAVMSASGEYKSSRKSARICSGNKVRTGFSVREA